MFKNGTIFCENELRLVIWFCEMVYTMTMPWLCSTLEQHISWVTQTCLQIAVSLCNVPNVHDHLGTESILSFFSYSIFTFPSLNSHLIHLLGVKFFLLAKK